SFTLSGTPLPATAPVSWTVPTRRPLTRTSSVAAPGTRSCDFGCATRCLAVGRAFVQPVRFSSSWPLVLVGPFVVVEFVLDELLLLTVVVIGAATHVIGALTVVVVTVIT